MAVVAERAHSDLSIGEPEVRAAAVADVPSLPGESIMRPLLCVYICVYTYIYRRVVKGKGREGR